MVIDKELLDTVSEQAKASPRLRMNFNFHQSLDEKCHRFLNAVEPGTEVPIHRHPTKDETFVCVRGDKGSLVTIGGHDPRVTRSGYFIRKFKFDELPQLINVFVGDMSLVGPRPEVRHYVDYWTPEQMHVLDVRPGITDPASIKFRNENEIMGQADDPEKYYIEVIMQEKIRLYLEYVNHHSFFGDLCLLLKTFWTVLMSHKGQEPV